MIVRAPRPNSNFYLLDKAISEDGRLSWSARGLLVFLLGKPDHWQVSPAALVNETAASARPAGRDAVYSLLRELIDVGYITRQQGRGEDGAMGSVRYLVSESPAPLPADPDAAPLPANPHAADPTQVSIEEKQGLKRRRDTRTKTEKARIGFDVEAGAFTIPEEIRQQLAAAYGQSVNLDAELSRAQVWCAMNPTRRPRSDFGRFVNAWMNRATADAKAAAKAPGLRVYTNPSPAARKQQQRDNMTDWLFAGHGQDTPRGGNDVIDAVATEVR